MNALDLWNLYLQHKSLRQVAKLSGFSYETVRQRLIKAGYDLDLVERMPTHKIKEAKVHVAGRINPIDAALLHSLPEGISYHLYEGMKEYCEKIRITKEIKQLHS